ncbi:alpha/beta hydrolase [Actinoplanes sp. N902-109]|uniref:alpha/beta hydrolase n=1 Tax=Actinoplanes sp. (strain N902-109) TaxID=649831 RepID=UPI0003296627|nr:alpha/beta hydrolase [Actinoplanes sp. N902-109]AGL16755.1 putative hydrolase [Actinoplanes sp. N902-109]
MTEPPDGTFDEVRTVRLANLTVRLRRSGAGDPILLLHGFPHTGQVWREVAPWLVRAGHQVIAPDLRGIGGTDRPVDGYDAATLALDQVQLLDALALPAAHVVGFDAGAAPAFALATGHPERVRSLTVVEAAIGGLAGAEDFLAGGGPWWFGFHQSPGGLAEDVVAGSEDRYIRHFLQLGSRAGVPGELADHFVSAYTGRDRLRGAFEHYRAMPGNAARNRAWAAQNRLTMPVTAVGAAPVGAVTARQLRTVADDVEEHLLGDSGHIVPVDAPRDLARLLLATAARS